MPAGKTYEPISSVSLSSSQSSIVFSSLGSYSYTDLRVVMTPIGTVGGAEIDIRFNSDSGSNYSQSELYSTGSGVFGFLNYARTELYPTNVSGIDATTRTLMTADIFNYKGSTKKTVLFTFNGASAYGNLISRSTGVWNSTSAITSITLFLGSGSFASGTKATLYGIAAA